MKRIVIIFLPLWLMMLNLSAQDQQLLSERDISGTARYMAMAGAMSTVGADPSAVLDNPAGLGLYRRLEASLTFAETLDYNRQKCNNTRFCSNFSLPQASFVFALENRNSSALRFCNFMFSFNRIKNFNRSTIVNASYQPSIANAMLDQVMDEETYVTDEAMAANSNFNNPEIGWLSEMGYQNYMIDPTYKDWDYDYPWNSKYVNRDFYGDIDLMPVTRLRLEETGYMDEFALNWAGNISDFLYIGVGLNIRSLYYCKRLTYWEDFPQIELEGSYYGGRMEYTTLVRQNGVGVSGNFGVIAQPVSFMRLGLAVQTPTAIKVNTFTKNYDMFLHDYADSIHTSCSTPNFEGTDRFNQPMRLTVGTSFFFGTKGMLSLQYDYRHHKQLHDIHTLKVGTEVVIAHNLFLEAGYACESDFKKENATTIYTLSPTTVRLDPDFRSIGMTHYVGAGVGYRGNYFVAHLGYQYSTHTFNQYTFATQDLFYSPSAAAMRDQTHRIVLTLAWHSKR